MLGKKFNLLVVISECGKNRHKQLIYNCLCDCGNSTIAIGSELRSGHKKSCGCLLKSYSNSKKFKDYSGIKFNKLLAISPTGKLTNNRGMIWNFLCDCGNYTETDIRSVVRNMTTSCGCVYISKFGDTREKLESDIIGQKFGMLILKSVELSQSKKFYCLVCDCGNNYRISKYLLKLCKIVDCGCNSDNEEKHKLARRLNPESLIWKKDVHDRDLWICKICNKSKYLQAHHIKNFKNNPQLRYSIDNGITLCKFCHALFHRKYGNKNNTIEQFEEFKKSFSKKL